MNYLPYVNIKMGSKSMPRYSNGNTLPLTQLPFAMAAFCPHTETKKDWDAWFYNPDYPCAEGIRLTHQPSPWIRDYGTFLMMPQNDRISDTPEGAWSGFRQEETVLRPDYIKMRFLRTGCTFELTPTERGGAIRLQLDNDRPTVFSFLPVHGNYTYRYDEKSNTLFGTNDAHEMDDAVNFKMYFAVRFLGDCVDTDETRIEGEGNTAFCHVALKSRCVEARIGISYISEEMALGAIERECGEKSFDALRSEAEEIWEERLHRIEVTTESEDEMRTFYSCLWRTFLFPHKAYEMDANGNAVHYTPCDGSVRNGVRYTDNGFWDTARTVYPLFSHIARDEFAEMLEGFVNDYRDCGWLPRWLSIGEVGCMPSTLIDGVIAEAAVQGIGKREVLETALEGMLHHANHEAEDRRYGRNGALEYICLGYVPRDVEHESVNLTQDAAYGDWCIATVAKVLGRDDLVDEYMGRSKNYRNIFDPTTGFMRGRDREGRMQEPFDPLIWGGEYTEGSAWQNSFFVPHDIEGLAALYGGREGLIRKLDELFASAPTYRLGSMMKVSRNGSVITPHQGGYRTEVHEMTEMGTANFGQCAISNQPSFHIPYIYAYLGENEKCAYWVHKMCREAFSATVDGYPGDEDNGTTSAWYIFSMLGMYPLCPGKRELVKIPPLVKSAKILGKALW